MKYANVNLMYLARVRSSSLGLSFQKMRRYTSDLAIIQFNSQHGN
jgi:hypothetical protein